MKMTIHLVASLLAMCWIGGSSALPELVQQELKLLKYPTPDP